MSVSESASNNEPQGKEEKDKETDHTEEIVNFLRQWLPNQKHIPDVRNDRLLYHFAASSKGNVRTACKKLDSYFTVRSLIPDFYDSRDPTTEDIKQSCDCISLGFLPGLSSDGSKVMLISLLKGDPSEFEFLPFIRRLFMYIDLNFIKDLNPGQGIYFLTDCQNSSLNHVMKLTPNVVRKSSVCLQDVYPIKLKGIIFINVKDFIKVTINTLMKPLSRPKIRKRFHLYGQEYSKLFAIIPKEVLPRDVGGHGPSYREINERAQEQLVSEREWLLSDGSNKTMEINRNGKCPISSSGCCIM